MSQASYSFHTIPSGIDSLLHSETGPMAQFITKLGNRAVNEIKARANVDTGLMRSRVEFRLEVEGGKLVGIVAARTEYSFYVNARYHFMEDGLRAAIG